MFLVGCAAPNYTWKTQPDKTDADRDRDYEYCIKEAGTAYGFLATMTWYGILNNTKAKYAIEENCLREKGWIY
jgi:hypothetical protein